MIAPVLPRTRARSRATAGASLALADAGIEMFDLVAACSMARAAGLNVILLAVRAVDPVRPCSALIALDPRTCSRASRFPALRFPHTRAPRVRDCVCTRVDTHFAARTRLGVSKRTFETTHVLQEAGGGW